MICGSLNSTYFGKYRDKKVIMRNIIQQQKYTIRKKKDDPAFFKN